MLFLRILIADHYLILAKKSKSKYYLFNTIFDLSQFSHKIHDGQTIKPDKFQQS